MNKGVSLSSLPSGYQVLKPARPPKYIADQYRKKLNKKSKKMILGAQSKIYSFFLKSIDNGIVVQDEKPISPHMNDVQKGLLELIEDLREEEEGNFSDFAPDIAKPFVSSVMGASSRDSRVTIGMGLRGVEFDSYALAKHTDTNINLIRSIPTKYFDRIKKSVIASFSTNRGEGTLGLFKHLEDYKTSEEDYRAVNSRRIKLIAEQETSKIYSQTHVVQMKALGVAGFIWHIGAPLHHRLTHLLRDGKVYKYTDFDINSTDDVKGMAGVPYGCQCFTTPIIWRGKNPANFRG
jgi:uncharacterized protein with gpF-like domain